MAKMEASWAIEEKRKESIINQELVVQAEI